MNQIFDLGIKMLVRDTTVSFTVIALIFKMAKEFQKDILLKIQFEPNVLHYSCVRL